MSTPYRHVPVLSEMYRSLRRLVSLVQYSGSAVRCDCCDKSFSDWRKDSGDACPYCGSLARQRILARYLRTYPTAPGQRAKALLFAPDFSTLQLLDAQPSLDVTTTDYSAPKVDFHWDITALPCADESFDLIMCSHVLEHVPDDTAAIAELSRSLSANGTVLVQVPYRRESAETDEDPSVTDPVEREKRFGQFDHVRVYGRDLADRLASSGLHVTLMTPSDLFKPDEIKTHGLWEDTLFVCRKGAPTDDPAPIH